ncbi:MAG: hypothetical protein J6A69_09055 [Clostridia bacterium]|nr:hypothetical protein [Clostridia bacterium]
MKKYFSLFFAFLFPYIFVFAMSGFFIIDGMAKHFLTYMLVSFIVILFCFVLGLTGVVYYLVSAKRSSAGALRLAKVNMIIKLAQIPAFISLFILAIIYAIGLFHAAILAVIVFAAIDFLAVLLTGTIGAVAIIINCKEKKVLNIGTVILGVCQFVFCVDVVAAIVAYKRIKRT